MGDWFSGAPSWVTGGKSSLREFLNDPKGFVVSLVLTWFITNVIVRPTAWFVAYVDWAVETAMGTVESSVKLSLSQAGGTLVQSVLGTIRGVNRPIENALMQAGLGAPLATTVILVVEAVIVTTILVLLVRIVLDAIPGGGALYR